MKESEVNSDFVQDVFYPSLSEFANFARYIKSLQHLTFALVSVYCQNLWCDSGVMKII